MIGGQHLLSQSFWRAAGATAEGIYVIAPIGSLTNSEYRNAADLLTQLGIVPDLVALYSYVAVQTWADAVRHAGNGEFKGVGESLRSREFTTALGRVAFDQKGDRRDIDFSIITWQKGLLRELRMVAQVPTADPSRRPLRKRIRQIAERHMRYGYRRITVLLPREGWPVTVKCSSAVSTGRPANAAWYSLFSRVVLVQRRGEEALGFHCAG